MPVKPLLIGLVAVLLGQEAFGISPETRAVIDRAPAVASPLTGYLTLGEFFVKNNRLERAKQIFAYGLLHAPEDPRFLSWLAVVEEKLHHDDNAREYALAALSFQPGGGPAQEVLLRLKPAAAPTRDAAPGASPAPAGSPKPDASPSPGTGAGGPPSKTGAGGPPPSPGASPAPGASPVPGASPAPKPKTLTPKELDLLASAVGGTAKDLTGIAKPPKGLDPGVKGDKLKALSVLRTVDAALKMYKLNHPKEEIKALDLKKLVEDKVLPKEVDLSGFPAMTLADGKLSMEGFGALDDIAGELKDYQAGLQAAARHREKNLLSEAHSVLLELTKKFEGDPELLERLLRIQLDMKLEFPGTETARKLFLARPAEPRNLWTLAVLLYRSSRPEKARIIAELMPRAYPDTFYTPAARALVALVDSKISPEAIQKLVEEREAAMAAEMASPAAPESPAASASPAASPSPAPSPAASPKH